MTMLNDRELGTVLAALRVWQDTVFVDADGILQFRDFIRAPSAEAYKDEAAYRDLLVATATDDGRVNPMDTEEIDALCERLNETGAFDTPSSSERRRIDHGLTVIDGGREN
jgi:hypothetical protein